MHRYELFYRNKPEPYWDNIRFNRNEIMEKYIKDSNGQAASPINDTIHGLFFSSNLSKGSRILPSTSPFGNVRLKVPAEKLFNPMTKLYFADFYCTYTTHYVTVVGCIQGSETDKFCSRALIPLKLDDNCFLRVYSGSGGWLEFWVNDNVWIEYFYTENVPLSLGEFNRVQSTGCSTPGGLPNNKYCAICNLYPVANPVPMRKRPGEDGSSEDGSEGGKRARMDQEQDADDAENDDEFNSTFHLAMELERDRLGSDSIDPGNVEVLETVCALIDSVIPEVGKCLAFPEHGNVGKPAPEWINAFKAETEKLRQELEEEERALDAETERMRTERNLPSAEPVRTEDEPVRTDEEKEAAAMEGVREISAKIDETVAATSEKPKIDEGVDKENMTKEGAGVIEMLKGFSITYVTLR